MTERYPKKASVYRRQKYQDRPCIRCKKQFKSAGNHHRLCSDCTKTYRRADADYVAMEVEGWVNG